MTSLDSKDFCSTNPKPCRKKLNIKDVPIITYCARKECDASEKLIDHLYECKFNNIYEWKEGIDGWNKNRSPTTLLRDKDKVSEEEYEDDDNVIDAEAV